MKERIQQFTRFLEAAGGRKPADLLLTNLMLVDVYTGEIRPASISVSGGRIAAIDPDPAAARKKSWTAADSSRSPALWTLMCI